MIKQITRPFEPERQHLEFIKGHLLDIITASKERRTPFSLEKECQERFKAGKEATRLGIRELVFEKSLNYTSHFGMSFVEISYNRPVHIPKHIVLKPPTQPYLPQPNVTVVNLNPGDAFGTGSHPTTRLAIRGIEVAFGVLMPQIGNRDTQALDIGTGSGVLSIVSVKLGIGSGVAVDIDPCARKEATKNIAINQLDKQIVVKPGLEEIEGRFLLITANLRFPTIKKLYPYLTKAILSKGVVVVSGVREAEISHLLRIYGNGLFICIHIESEKGWSCLAFQKTV